MTNGQKRYLYQQIQTYFPPAYTEYEDNKLWKRLGELSDGEYRYLLALNFNNKVEQIKEKIYGVPN